MICDWCKVQIQNKLLHWFDSLLLNNQQMWVSEGFPLRFSVLFSWLSLPPSLNQDYMYIFDKTITKYTKEIMSVLWLSSSVALARPLYHYHLRQNNHHPWHCRFYHQSCQHYNNYYTIFYIQQVINKLKVISAVCVVKEHVLTLKEAEPYLHKNPI